MSSLYCAFLFLSLHPLISCFELDVFGSTFPDRLKPTIHFGDFNITGNSDYRLPASLTPTEYNLTFIPFLSNSTFKGYTAIIFDVVTPTNLIVLNARFETLQADSFEVSVHPNNNGAPLKIVNTTIDKEHQMIWFQLENTLQKQKGIVIRITYDGILASDMMGFYLSSYNTTDSKGVKNTHKLAITQFESTFARRAFPCFDEPSYRANFTIGIARLPNQMSMSNMKLNYSKTISLMNTNMILDVYNTTPKMPTYLVAFGVSDFYVKSDNGNVRVFTRADVIQDATLALSIAQPILYSIGNFTSVPYSLEKMDIVALPDFKAGAMENWGLTTYREKYVIYNANKNTHREWFGVVSVIAHEFAHQWFGDLVTPLWWDYTWLNEAFATYFEYITPNQLYPELKIGSTMYVTETLQYALDVDINDTRAMTSPVYTANQIEGIFDYVIYDKGGSVLRMIENFLTTAVWKDGLRRYLEANGYKTGTPDSLFSALQDAANAAKSPIATSVAATLTTWTTQPGYPVVKLQKQPNSKYLLTQTPYELNNTKLKWSIPVTYTWQEEAQFNATKAARMLLYNTEDTVTINTTGWVIVNVDQIGYFRVNYDEDNWSKIIAQLNENHTVIGVINRAQLIDDAFHLARTGNLSFYTAMALTGYLPKETEYAPWKAFFTNMRFLVNQFYNTPTGEALMKYARSVMTSPFKALTANLTESSSSFLSSITLLEASQFSCDMGLPACETLSSLAFQMWTKDPNSISPETKQAAICTQLRLDTEGQLFQGVLDYFLISDNGAEQLALMRAMGCISNPSTINKYLNVICDANANLVRLQDRNIAINALLSHQTGLTTGLQYIVNNYNKVSQALVRLDSIFSTLGKTISQDTHIAQIKVLLNDTSVDQGLRSKLETLVLPSVLKRQGWADSPRVQQLKNWLDDNSKSSAVSIFANLSICLLSIFLVIGL